MIGRIGIRNGNHEIPAVWVCPDGTGPFPVMILCHGTASHKDEVGNLFVQLANRLAEQGIASIRFDYAGCGESREKEEVLTFSGEIETPAVSIMPCANLNVLTRIRLES